MTKKKPKKILSKKGRNKFYPNFKWVMIFVTAILGVVILSQFTHEKDKNQIGNITKTVPTIVPPEKTLPDWEIAYNSVYSIQYPTSYTQCETGKTPPGEENKSVCLIDKEVYYQDKDFYDYGWGKPKKSYIFITSLPVADTTLSIGPNNYADTVSEDEFYNSTSNFWKNLPKQSGNGGIRNFSYEIVTIGLNKAIKETVVGTQGVESEDDITYTYYIYVPKLNNTVVTASYSIAPNSYEFQQYTPAIEEIISTIKLSK